MKLTILNKGTLPLTIEKLHLGDTDLLNIAKKLEVKYEADELVQAKLELVCMPVELDSELGFMIIQLPNGIQYKFIGTIEKILP